MLHSFNKIGIFAVYIQVHIIDNELDYLGSPLCVTTIQRTGPRLNKKDGLTRYGDSHVKDKTS